jgi:hypothetical protein
MDLVEDDVPVVRPEFAVDTRDKAEWAMTTLARAERSIFDKRNAAQVLMVRIQERCEQMCKRDADTVAKMTDLLHPWAQKEIAKSGGQKHVKLVAGDIGFRQNPERIDWVGTDTDLAALPDELKRVKIEPNKVAAKKSIKEKGELPAGFEIVAGDIQWYVKTNLDGLPDGALDMLDTEPPK